MNNLQFLIDLAASGDESDVTCLADAILIEAEKDYRHGYIVRHQQNILHPQQVMINNDLRIRGIPDITVSVMRGDVKILVIECKGVPIGIREIRQLSAYMSFCEFPNGLLINNTTSHFFTMGQDDLYPTQGSTFNNHSEIDNIIQVVRDL